MKKKILLVDDEKDVTMIIKMNLEKTGNYEVETVNDPTLAVAAAMSFRPDIIVLDMIMPGMDGGDVKRQLREKRIVSGIPVIFLTALVTKMDTTPDDPFVHSGDGIMIPKPVTTALLIQCIEATLAQTT